MKTVGVVIPIYNVEKYLRECLDSVINQTYTNLEIILVNDGSTDENSFNIAKEYTLKDKRITLIDKKNGGQSTARNVGIEYFSKEYKLKNKTQNLKENSLIEFEIEGNNPYEIYTVYKSYQFFKDNNELLNFKTPDIDYIIFLDSDDYWELNCIEECVPRMDGVEVVWFDYSFYYDGINSNVEPKTILESFNFNHSCIITSEEWLKKMIENKLHSFWFGWHGMIDFSYLKNINLKFLDYIIHEDHYFAKLLFVQANKIYVFLEKIYCHRIRPDSIMTSRNKPTFENTPLHMREIYQILNSDAKLFREFYRNSSLLITACMIFEFVKTHRQLANIELFEQVFMQKLKSWRDLILKFPEQYIEFMFENTFQRIASLKQNLQLPFLQFISVFFTDLNIAKNHFIKNAQDKDKIIAEKDTLINSLNSQIQTLNNEKNSLQNSLNSLPTKKAKLEVLNLEQDLNLKKLQGFKIQKDLGKKFVQNVSVNFIDANSAKARIHNHLAYKLGSALIRNSKSFLGYIKIPYVLFAIALAHKEQNANLKFAKLPSLESYADYKEALKEKECFTYKLDEALMKAHKNWYKGGYLKFYFKDVPRLKREFRVRKS